MKRIIIKGDKMIQYYIESKWSDKKGIDIHWVYKKGEVPHFATFYDEKKVKEYVNFLNNR